MTPESAAPDRVETNFRHDASVLLAEVRAMMAHYRLNWDCYIVMRKPGSVESFVVVAAPDDESEFRRELVGAHRVAARRGR